MVYAVWTWDMSSCGTRTCLVVGEEYMLSCWRRIYGYGRCILVGEEYMVMEDVFVILIFLFLVIFYVLLLLLCIILF